MRKSPTILLSVTVLLIVSLACVLPNVLPGVSAPTPDPNAVGTAIMLTMQSALTQTAGVAVPIDVVSSPTLTPEPTLSPTATLSPTPMFTNTPLIPLVNVSVNTNCRVGPGEAYERVGALMVGETVQTYGRNPTGRYWYVQNPDRENEYCWLWGEYATVVGNVAAVPIFTPPPTPTPVPGFDVDYAGLQSCAGWWVDFELTNTGGMTFKSISLTVKDINTDDDISMYQDRFTAIDDCVDSTTEYSLDPGDSLVVSAPAFAYDPSGHKLRATITLCSVPGQNGTCVAQTIKFSP